MVLVVGTVLIVMIVVVVVLMAVQSVQLCHAQSLTGARPLCISRTDRRSVTCALTPAPFVGSRRRQAWSTRRDRTPSTYEGVERRSGRGTDRPKPGLSGMNGPR